MSEWIVSHPRLVAVTVVLFAIVIAFALYELFRPLTPHEKRMAEEQAARRMANELQEPEEFVPAFSQFPPKWRDVASTKSGSEV